MPEPPAGVWATRRSPGSYRLELDSGGAIEVSGRSPRSFDLVLAGLAACSGRTLDQVLARMRLEVAAVELSVRAERRPEPPETLTRIELTWRIAAGSAPADRVRRAVELSERHCPVLATLRAAAPVEVRLELT
ncbi:MAG TPA: OsmC family protein [Candidatus Dormibacteraeota bacterium]|nr:OsmC family protein [Candidatus Dormibacteraeota bacterium]